MRKIHLLCAALLSAATLLSGCGQASETRLSVISYNIRMGEADDGGDSGEHMSIFYDSETVSLVDWGTFWLSESPGTPSKGWDAACPRTATWALMEKDGRRFYYVNTHLDHIGKEAQKNGLALIVDRIADINPEGIPMVLTGDFNVTPEDSVLDELKTRMFSARDSAAETDTLGSFNGWGESDSILDYVWHSVFALLTF